ncbi:MAG TPA: hypothetical protein DDY98_08305 [Ruminococcaceae bacterium]|nr:hypothetical protein [Oscillospiraceae bacterium]
MLLIRKYNTNGACAVFYARAPFFVSWNFFDCDCIFSFPWFKIAKRKISGKGDAPQGADEKMDIEFKRTGKPIWTKLGIYAAALLCVGAIGLGSYAAMRKEFRATEITTQLSLGVPSNETLNVVVPQTQEVLLTEPTTEEKTTKKADNLPFTGSFALPLSTEILKDYSDGEMVHSQTMDDWRVHNGIDFTGKKDSEVRAVQRGKITAIYEDEMWGTVVEIDHENGMTVKYCGFTKSSVLPKGTVVKKGETIGKLGEIPVESAEEPHLHIEITVDGKIVDPLAAMNRAE